MLDIYFSLTQKSSFLDNIEIIDSQSQFDNFISYLLERNISGPNYWRGMNDASFKLYNSCQRYYNSIMNNDNLEEYHELIFNLINYVHRWNNGTVSRYLESQEIINDAVAAMTLMQHYGFPTPLLDFSEDPFVALYFSMQDSRFDLNTEDLRNYSALYCLDADVQNLLDFNTQYEISNTIYKDQFTPLLATKLLLISKDTKEFKIGTSLNIINQTGSFIYSNNPVLPLEEMFNTLGQNMSNKSKLQCWHIHKKFSEQIRLFLKRNFSINTDYIFPDLYKMIEHFHQGRD